MAPQIAPEDIMVSDGLPVRITVEIDGPEDERTPVKMYAFGVPVTRDLVMSQAEEMRAKAEAMATLTGHELEGDFDEAIENLIEQSEGQVALAGDPFFLCWN